MKSIIFLAALAVLAVSVSSEDTGVEEPVAVVSVDAGVEESGSVAREDVGFEVPVATRRNLVLGSVGGTTTLLYRHLFTRRAQANAVQWQEILIRTAPNVRIRAIRALQVGANQNPTARLVGGGIGQTFAVVRLQTARGRGYNYQLEVWGRRV